MRVFGALLAIVLVAVAANRCDDRRAQRPSVSVTPDEVASPAPPSESLAAPADDAWVRERERPKSSALATYEEAAEPIDRKIALAGIALQCGLRTSDWYGDTVRVLESYRQGPVIGPVMARLSPAELRQAYRFDHLATDGTRKFNAGTDGRPDCQQFAAMPFAQSDTAFLP